MTCSLRSSCVAAVSVVAYQQLKWASLLRVMMNATERAKKRYWEVEGGSAGEKYEATPMTYRNSTILVQKMRLQIC